MISPSDSSARKVLVIGGRGFVGSYVIRRLLAEGYSADSFGPKVEADLLADLEGRFGSYGGSVEERAALDACMQAGKYDAVVTTAAFGAGKLGLMRSGEADAERALSVNVNGLRNVFEAAREAGVRRVVWTSSTVVYGPADLYGQGRVDETAERRPRTFYGLTKLMGESLAQYQRDRFGQDIAGLRLPLVLARDLWYSGAAAALIDLFRAAEREEPHKLAFHDEPLDLMHGQDAAGAILATIEAKGRLAPVYNVNGFTARVSELIAAIRDLRPQARIEHEVTAPAQSFPLVADGRFRQDTGFEPVYDRTRFLREMLSGEKGE